LIHRSPRFPLPASRFPLPASHFPLPTSRFPLPLLHHYLLPPSFSVILGKYTFWN
jgi:hypothetical protein